MPGCNLLTACESELPERSHCKLLLHRAMCCTMSALFQEKALVPNIMRVYVIAAFSARTDLTACQSFKLSLGCMAVFSKAEQSSCWTRSQLV